MSPNSLPEESGRRSKVRLGLFGATRAGKTVFLTTLYWLSKKGQLPAEVRGVLPADPESAGYLGERYAMLEAGQWPRGNVTSHRVTLEISLATEIITLATNDFRGGDFTAAFYSEDPSHQQQAQDFVRQLFAGCSAYVFLIDCSDVNAAENQGALDDHAGLAQRTGAVETALNILRRDAWGFRLLHRPVAVVFTKADQQPECLADAEGYAKRNLRPTWDYLRQHASSGHRFFAVTSTGSMPQGSSAPPPAPLKPSENFLEPILWCSRLHERRVRFLRLGAAAIFLTLLACAWGSLFVANRHALADLAAEAHQAPEDQLPRLYGKARQWNGSPRFALTQPGAALPLSQAIVNEAEQRLHHAIDGRLDSTGNIRTIDDYTKVAARVDQFAIAFPNTENEIRLKSWIQTERLRLGQQVARDLASAARTANEHQFEQLRHDYDQVAAAALDPQVAEAARLLKDQLLHEPVKQLWLAVTYQQDDIDPIRQRCSEAESMLNSYPENTQYSQYVQAVRELYDRLKREPTASLEFQIRTKAEFKARWWFEIDGVDRAKSDAVLAAVKLNSGEYQLHGGKTEIDLLATRAVRVALNVHDWKLTSWSNSHLTTPLFTPEQIGAMLDQPVVVTSDRHIEYRIVFSGGENFSEFSRAMTKIKKLGDELFRTEK
jgi:hypothetical protein